MKLTDLLDQIDRLDQQATQGPWIHGTSPDDSVNTFFGQKYCECCPPGEGSYGDLLGEAGRPDAEFIALARTALPKLAEAVYQVLALLDAEENRPSRITAIDGLQRTAQVPTSEVRQAITDALGADDD